MSTQALLADLAGVVGAAQTLVDPELRAGYETDWTGRYSGRALCVVRPGSTAEVASVLRLCGQRGAAVVPQGGNTGLVGGGVPRGGEVVLSTRRLDELEVDADHGELLAGAGAPLASVRDAAHRAGWDFGVDLASRDSATVGGMVATNAGGEHVVRYGPMRNHVLGVEAVLADGSVVGRVPALRKDNTGYEWAGVLGGSEGTLAVVTRVHLGLVAAQPDHVVALVGLDDFAAAVGVAGELVRRIDSLLALEVVFADGLRRVCAHTGLPTPFPREWPVALLVEVASGGGVDHETERLAAALEATGAARATAVASDAAGRARLWEYRDRHAEAINADGVPHKLDVTLPHRRLVEFAAKVVLTVAAVDASADVVLFGHLGDGNLHVNVLGPAPDDSAVDHAVLVLVASMGGSISAEHGIGIAKRRELSLSRSEADIAAMQAVKTALDPRWMLNPGVLLPDPAAETGKRPL